MLWNKKLKWYLLCVLMGNCFCFAKDDFDRTKYIGVDEIKPGMKAYCLTCYKGTQVEKFEMEVVDVVRRIWRGKDAIIVKGLDERFIHTGPVQGCSGSPVYIDGRMAGALSFGWIFSKDALYGVTLIKDMLEVNAAGQQLPLEQTGFSFDYSKPIDFQEISRCIESALTQMQQARQSSNILFCPLVTSGFPTEAFQNLDKAVRPFGFTAVAGSGTADSNEKQDVKLEPGACLTVPLCRGDLSMTVLGTATEVIDNRVYGFGHSFLGYGPVDLPMATGKIYTVVANSISSFKMGCPLDVVGALKVDEASAVYGEVGQQAKIIPLKIKVNRYNIPQEKVYNCQMADNKVFTPQIINMVLNGAILMAGNMPPTNTLKYSGKIELEDLGDISYQNISSSVGSEECLTENMAVTALLLNNPYRKINIKSMEFDLQVLDKNVVSNIWSAELLGSPARAGEKVTVSVIIETFLAGKRKYDFDFVIPDGLGAGEYKIAVLGGYDYRNFIIRERASRFTAENAETLIDAIRNALNIARGRLYCSLMLPPAGVTIEKGQLPDLPATKALVLADDKKAMKVEPYNNWIEKSVPIEAIVAGQKTLTLKVIK